MCLFILQTWHPKASLCYHTGQITEQVLALADFTFVPTSTSFYRPASASPTAATKDLTAKPAANNCLIATGYPRALRISTLIA